MATTGVINGTNLRLYIDSTPVAYATSCTLSFTRELRSVIHKDNPGSGWAESEPGQKSGTCSIEALYNEDGTSSNYTVPRTLWDALDDGTKLTCTVETGTAGDNIYSFSAYLSDYEVNAAVEENATYSATLTITGAVTMLTT
jgi:hypothetical protein